MAQTLKNEMRERIERAAITEFAAAGFHRATVSAIARSGGLSAGNVYRYFDGKRGLFDAVVDDAFVAEFDAMLDTRVGALADQPNLRVLDGAAAAAQSALLDVWIANRLRVVILLDRSESTRLEPFAASFVSRLVEAFERALQDRAGVTLGPPARFVLTAIFDNTRTTLVSILESHTDPDAIRGAFSAFWSFQLAGLAGFEQEMTR